MTRILTVVVALAMLGAACGAGDDATGPAPSSSSVVSGGQESPVDRTDASLPSHTVPGRFDPAAQPLEGATPVTGEVPDHILDLLLADANTTADGGAFEVTVAEAVVWSDGSMGCPEPGVLYTQALIDGYHVVLSSADEAIDYRVGQNDYFFRCERTGTTPAGIGTIGGGGGPGEPTG
jgi:hypothetical protein